MTDYMAQPGLSLAPSSRQDIISALLNDYGNSFQGGDSSPYAYSPIPTPKDLPPTPPEKEREYGNFKPISPAGRMSMRFQLRVDEPASPTSSDRSRSSSESSPTQIVSRRLNRNSKPPSLKLTVSNGSTAIVPPTPSLPQPSPVPSSTPREREKSLPPPPPEKSERRQQQQASMGTTSSAERPPRKDSLPSREPEAAATPVKRKPLPLPKFTSLAQLGGGPRGGKGGPLPPAPRPRKQSVEGEIEQIKNGRSASAVETSRPRKPSVDDVDEQANNGRSLSAIATGTGNARSPRPSPKPSPGPAPAPPAKFMVEEDAAPRATAPTVNRLPPTPDENPLPPPPPTKKPFAGMGLPSNPRAKALQHTRGKSSTGFNFMKSSKASPAPELEAQAPVVETITPGPTPSPRKMEEVKETRVTSPASPTLDDSQRRPFSFEAGPPPAPPKDMESAPAPAPVSGKPDSPITAILPQELPPRSTSRTPPAFASLPSQQRSQQQPPAPPAPSKSYNAPSAFASLPSQQRLREEEFDEPPTPPTPATYQTPKQQTPVFTYTNPALNNGAPMSPPPFTPLTKHPMDRPAAPLTTKHLTCYSHHSNYVWSKNTFQPMACMVCKSNDKERKWACVWCYLRVCLACSAELMKTPNRDLKTLMEKRGVDTQIEGEQQNMEAETARALARKEDMKRHDSGTAGSLDTPSVVIWRADEDQDFS